MKVPKIWGLPTNVSIRREIRPGADVESIALHADVHGSKLEYIEIFAPAHSCIPERLWGDRDFNLVLMYMENLFSALITDLRIDFGTEPLRESITPREPQGE